MERLPDLFGEPWRCPEKSQLFTPDWVASRLAMEWVPPNARVLEPSCGKGDLIAPLIKRGHDPRLITCVERDPRFAAYTRERFEGKVAVFEADFHEIELLPAFDISVLNSPFEDNEHLRFTLKCLRLSPVVAGIFPMAFESTQERDDDLWSKVGVVAERAQLPVRPKYLGPGGSFESVALCITRRMQPRRVGEARAVREMTWLPTDEAVLALREGPCR